jgi:hypothetical protein
MPDAELYEHLSPPNGHWTIDNCRQVHCPHGLPVISRFFHVFLKRWSISNLVHVVDRRIVHDISFLWASQSASSFQRYCKWVKSCTCSYQFFFLLFQECHLEMLLILRIRDTLQRANIHLQSTIWQSHFVDILLRPALTPLSDPSPLGIFSPKLSWRIRWKGVLEILTFRDNPFQKWMVACWVFCRLCQKYRSWQVSGSSVISNIDLSLQNTLLSLVHYPNLKHLILRDRLKLGLDLSRFEAFESQNSNLPELFHLTFLQEGRSTKKTPEIWPDLTVWKFF